MDLSIIDEIPFLLYSLVNQFMIIILLAAFVGFLIMLIPQARGWVGGFVGGNGRGRRGSMKLITVLGIFALCISLTAVAVQSSTASTGYLECNTSAPLGVTFAVKVCDLTPSTNYALEINSVEYMNWTTSTTETSRVFFIPSVEADGEEYMLLELLYGDGDIAESMDVRTVWLYTAIEIFSPDWLVEIGITILTVIFIVGTIVYIKKRFT